MELIYLVIFWHFGYDIMVCYATSDPEYRAIVYPKLFEGRDESTKVLKISDQITLNLRPSFILHDDFFVRKYREGTPEHKYFNVEALQRGLYHDAKQLAAVTVSEEDGALRVEGVVGPQLKIRPVKGSERTVYGDQAHIVDATEHSKEESVFGKIFEDKIVVSERKTSDRVGYDSSKFNVQSIHPEVLITCDSVFLAGFKNKEDMIRYVLIMFQVVILRYSTVTHPRIQPVLLGIEISDKTQEDKYYNYLGDGLIAIPSLYNISYYVKAKKAYYKDYDLIYFLTGYDIIVPRDNEWDRSYRGFAFVGSACLGTREQLGEDIPHSFRGIRTMVHEMAHTLGCDHDESTIEGHLPGYIANSSYCPWGDGYIMSYVVRDTRSMQFSPCCNYDMRRYSWMHGAGCLHKRSTRKISKKWKKTYKFPGEFTNKDKQCQLTYPFLKKTYHMKDFSADECMISCFVRQQYRKGKSSRWATELFDGSPCERNHKQYCEKSPLAVKSWPLYDQANVVCLNGKCVSRSRLSRPTSE